MSIEQNKSTEVVIDGRQYSYFGGTNYLGLAQRPELMQAAARAFERFGFSSGASRVTSGETAALLSLEAALSAFANAEEALVLPAGYLGNAVVVDAVEDEVDAWVIQPQAHSSIKSALRQSAKPILVDDRTDKRPSLHEHFGLRDGARIAAFTEPIDPMTGELFDLETFEKSLRDSDFLIMDEAHSFGVLGASGGGACEHFTFAQPRRVIRTGTFSKAIGTFGGFVLADSVLVRHMKERSGCFKGSTTLAPPICAATEAALELMKMDRASTVDALKSNISFVNQELGGLGIKGYSANHVPIYNLPNSHAVANLRSQLPMRGLYVPTVSSYFGDLCEIGLRWTIQAGHTKNQLRHLLNAIAEVLQTVQ